MQQQQQQQQYQKHRTKERFVWEAMQLVQQWRLIYDQGIVLDENGRRIKITLEQAAEFVGCPRKTLEDYYYLLKQAEKLVNLEEKKQLKMGYIRKLCKENKKSKQQIQQVYGVKLEDGPIEQYNLQDD